MFIGREKELGKLLQLYKSKKFEFGIIHGRRRIGKTTLLKESIKDENAIYFLAQKANEKTNLEMFSKTYFQKKGVLSAVFSSFNDFFETIFKEKNLVVVIDEFTYLTSSSISIESILQGLIDQYQDHATIKLIISGSEVGMFENLFSQSKPLFNRQTFQMQMKECDYFESSLYYPKFSNEDKIRTYAVFGGLPYYLHQIDDSLTLKENICRLVIDENASFADEISLILHSELRSIEEYQSILQAVHSGSTRLSVIDSKSHINNTSKTAKYIAKLVQLEIIEKELCFLEKPSSQKHLYRIRNHFVSFYYHFIWINANSRTMISNNDFYAYFIQPNIDKFVSERFESICVQFLQRKFYERNKEPILKLGRYWYNDRLEKKDVEIDICIKTNNSIFVYECKWTNSSIDEGIMTELKRKGKMISASYYGAFSKHGFSNIANKSNYDLIGVDTMFEK